MPFSFIFPSSFCETQMLEGNYQLFRNKNNARKKSLVETRNHRVAHISGVDFSWYHNKNHSPFMGSLHNLFNFLNIAIELIPVPILHSTILFLLPNCDPYMSILVE